MERWNNKVAVVTGASSGIGKSVVEKLIQHGLIVVGLARRSEKVEEIRKNLTQKFKNNLHVRKCDVSNEENVLETFNWIDKELGGADILVNNAGIFKLTELTTPNNTNIIKETLDTNVLGCFYCVRSAFNSMKSRKIDGHVIIINSVAGHMVPNLGPQMQTMNIYPASKHAVTAMVETYRQEFFKNGTRTKITSISPGLVDTDIMPDEIAAAIKGNMPMLNPDDIADAIIYCLGTPPNVQIHELTIKPIGEVY